MSIAEKSYRCIGIMSGTSLDGVDIVGVEFVFKNKQWAFSIIDGKTYAYDDLMLERLVQAQNLSGLALAQLNVDYGIYLGQLVQSFCAATHFNADFVASHGYTVFHQPEKSLTLQIGSGAHIAAHSKIQTICDFRTLDVALGGQGAPLVPIGDELLFANYVACLNLGGFSNISFTDKNHRLAFDICPVNYVLNYFTNKIGLAYDDKGTIARQGTINEALLNYLNSLAFYKQDAPKSLGREFVEDLILPFISKDIAIPDILHTFCEHASMQMANVINTLAQGEVLITGGGAYNQFLIERLKAKVNTEIVIPNNLVIDFKEALVFAFLGLLRINNMPNCLQSVTGAINDNCGGVIFRI